MYAGRPQEFYEPDRFNAFVRERVVDLLGDDANGFSVEGMMPNAIYHFPNAHIGLACHMQNLGDCSVEIFSTRRGFEMMNRVRLFILQEEKFE